MKMGVAAPGWVQLGVWACLLALLPIPHTAAFGIPKFLEFGDCASLTVDPELNFEMYSGIWFNIENVPNEYTDVAGCSMTNYTWTGELMTVAERGVDHDGRKVLQKSLMRPSEDQPGVLTVDAEGVPSAPYVVVGTDYDNYACVHSCMSFMGFRAAFSWVFTRQPDPDSPYLELCRDMLAEKGIDPSAMKPVEHGKECPYVEKLDSVLAYSKDVQSRAKAKAMEKSKKNYVVEVLVDQENGQKEPQSLDGHNSSLSVRETIETFTSEEKTQLGELERKMEGEQQLVHKLEGELRGEEEEIQELRELLIHESRHNRGEALKDHTNGSEGLRQSSYVVLLGVGFHLVRSLV